MRCSRVRKNMSPYIDGELLKRKRELIETHLISCKECGKALEDMLSMHNLFSERESFKAPSSFFQKILLEIENEGNQEFQWFPFLSGLVRVAIVLMIVTLGIVAGRFTGSKPYLQKASEFASSFSLDLFNATPPDTLAGAYVALTEDRNEGK